MKNTQTNITPPQIASAGSSEALAEAVMQAEDRPAQLWTADDVAKRLGMGVDWVYSETRAGRIPYVPLGRYVRYRPDSIEQWLRARERATLPDNVNRRGTVAAAPATATGRYS